MSNKVKQQKKKQKNIIPHYTNSEKVNVIIKESFDKLNIKDQSTQEFLVKIIKFVIVGGIATVISGIVFFLCDYFTEMSVLISNTIAFTISVIYNYWASCKYVFEVNKELFLLKTL